MNKSSAEVYLERQRRYPTKMIYCRVPIPVVDLAKSIARSRGMTFSDVIRAGLEKFSDELKPKEDMIRPKAPVQESFKLKPMDFDTGSVTSHWK